MQVLIFQLGAQEYALPTRHVVRVLPVMTLTRLAPAAAFIAGVMNYHGAPVPVIDLARVNGMPDAAQAGSKNADAISGSSLDSNGSASFDTRIVLVDHVQPSGHRHLLGLLVEHVCGVRTVDFSSVSDSGIRDPNAPFLGQVLPSQPRLLQLIELAQLVPPHVCEWLFDGAVADRSAHASASSSVSGAVRA